MSSLSTILNRRHLPALDGLRAVFVMLVFLYHGGLDVPGDLGVTGFFVLSGFLITWLLIKEWDNSGSISLKGFYLRRALRIFPAYYVFIALTMIADAALGLFRTNWGTTEILSALTYTVNYDNALTGHNHPVAHAWSLAIEEQFYLIWPGVFFFFFRKGRLGSALLLMIAAVMVWRTLLFGRFDFESTYVYNAFDTRFDALAIGCLIAVLAKSDRFLTYGRLLARRPWFPVPVVVFLYVSRVRLGAGWHYSLGFTMDALLLGILMVQMLQLTQSRWWRWLDHPMAVWLGAISYPLYLWHAWGLAFSGRMVDPATRPASHLFLGLILSISLAASSFYFVERPFLLLKRKIRGKVDDPATLPGSTSGRERYDPEASGLTRKV